MRLTARQLFAALILLRIALGPYVALAGQPAELFRPIGVMRLLPIDEMPSAAAIVAIQLAGILAAATAIVGRAPRATLATSWLALVVLAGLRTSLGKVLHNDLLLILGVVPFLFVRSDDDDNEQRAKQAAALILTTVYVLTGVAKLRHSGLAWVTSDNMRYVMLQASRSGRPAFPDIAEWIGTHAAASKATAAGILGLELAFPLVLTNRTAIRTAVAVGAIALHVGTWLTLGIDYWLWAATVAIVFLHRPARINPEP